MGKAMKQDLVEIKPVEFKHTMITIVGETSLLVNKMTQREQEKIEAKEMGLIKGKGSISREPRNPEKEYLEKVHWIKKGVPGFPSKGIKEAMISAGGRIHQEVMTKMRAYFIIPEPLLEIKGSKPVLDKQVGYLKGTIATMIYRARFDKWEIDIPIRYIGSVDPTLFFNLLYTAGHSIGLGSCRPEKNGTNGQFTLKQLMEGK